MAKTIELTEMETIAMGTIKEEMDLYGDGFSDVMIEDIADALSKSVKVARGVVGSLIKKGLVEAMDVNDEYKIYYIENY